MNGNQKFIIMKYNMNEDIVVFYRRTNHSIVDIMIDKLQNKYYEIKKTSTTMTFEEFMDSYYIENKDGEMELNIGAILKIK